MIPGVGLVLGWTIAAYAIGRGLFVAVAMRRMPRDVAESVYIAHRFAVLLTGGVLAAVTYVPLANLLIPVIGVAAMVHVLDVAMTRGFPGADRPPTAM
jgi:CysZ protein